MENETIELLKAIKSAVGPILCLLGMIFVWLCAIGYRLRILYMSSHEREKELKKQTALLQKLIPAPKLRKLGQEKPKKEHIGKYFDGK